ncbi:DUF4259 domain-containing protein [Streptomyces sp. NPDC019507]|uniref:DUF4259 domain-containing protein n=1 Tax=Streptomyces sp. NPDC019507 TaxID=3154689 RepID=UPI0033CB64D5
MGTWDVGPFDNDTAADWCDALDAATTATREGIIRHALARTIDTTGRLDASVSEEAVAAAALVAAQCPGGEPADHGHGPEQPLPDLTGLRTFAFQALNRVMTEPSELMTLWATSDGEPWQETINQLRATLQPQPPEDQLS